MRKLVLIAGAIVAVALCSGQARAGHSVTVGNCKPGSNNVDTIGDALNVIGNPGTINVCPGVYREQVVIGSAKIITLKGVTVGNSSAAVIKPPSDGLSANAASVFSGDAIAAQIVVRDEAVANISNLVVDGSGNKVSGCSPDVVGILFQNTSGSVKNSSIVNQALESPDLIGCQSGEAVYAQSSAGGSSVTVSDNFVGYYQKNGITGNGNGLSMTVSGNTVEGQGATTGAAENSIQIGFGAGGSVSGNWVADDVWAPDTINDPGDAASGILVFDSPGVTVTKNIVTDTQYGIAIEGYDYGPDYDYPKNSDNAVVTNNRVSGTLIFDGIDVCGSSSAQVGTNSIVGSAESGIHIDSGCGSASSNDAVTGNKINAACAGILVGTGSYTPTPGSNSILNTPTQILTGSDICPAAPASPANMSRVRVGKHRSAPLR